MQLTNKLNLPQALVDAVSNDDRDIGNSHITISGLIGPPLLEALRAQQKDNLIEDVSDRIWALIGQIGHGILERANTVAVAEQRFFMKVDNWNISGKFDSLTLENGELCDFKFTTAWRFLAHKDSPKGYPTEYEEQLNCYAYLLHVNGIKVKSLRIVAILRDWSKLEAKRNPNYPQLQVVSIPITLWPLEQTLQYIESRVAAHKAARQNLPEKCSEEDRWYKPPTYAVIKKGAKRATKVLDTRQAAEAFLATMPSGSYIVERGAANIRCESYCPVSKFCSWWQSQPRNQDLMETDA